MTERVALKATILSGLVFAGISSGYAAPPAVKSQPGFYRMMLGDFEITALNDGVVPYVTKRVLPTASAAQIRRELYEAGLTDPVGMSYNAFLVNTGRDLVLIDTGTGGKLDDEPEFHGAGHLIGNLRAAGYQPDQVDAVLITHRGQDHIGGLTVDNQRVFPNAVVWAPKAEFDMFLDQAKTSAILAEAHNNEKVRAWLAFTRALFEPYIRAGRFQSFESDQTIVPGIRSLATHGHTPGHTSYVVESRGQTLIAMGDLVLMGALQFPDPSLGSSFDVDPKSAAQQRLRVFKMAMENDHWVAGGHLPFPALGHIRAQRGSFRWVPVTYAIPH